MTTFPWVRGTMVIVALVALSAFASVPMAHAAPLAESATASSVTVPQSGTCPAGGQQDEHCLPGGPGNPAGSGSSPTPPVTPPVPPTVMPPAMPPVTLPIMPPPGIPPEELSNFIWGRAKATLHIHDDNQDVTYTSKGYQHMPSPSNDWVYLLFSKRPVQDMPGNTQYILHPFPEGGGKKSGAQELIGMTWTVRGTVFGCTVEGEAIITFPLEPDPNNPYRATLLDPTRDPTRPAYGYMNVVGSDGGDYHSVMIKAFAADAYYTKTCPGNPAVVTEEPFGAGYLLHILWQKNTHEDGGTRFKGQQSHDEGDPLDFLKLLPPGAAIPDSARQALSQMSGSGTSRRYTWEWELSRIRGAE